MTWNNGVLADCNSVVFGQVGSIPTSSTNLLSPMIIVSEWINESREIRTKHLDLDSPCIERGGNSTNHRGVLAEYLNTDFPNKIDLCHACHNGLCSNPKHLYWGTRKENVADAKSQGAHKNPFEHSVAKHGYEKACELNKR